MMDAIERGDTKESRALAEAYALTPQYQEWTRWGEENLRQQEELAAQQQQSRGFSL